MLVHSLLLLGTFATSVITSCYLALFLLMFVLAVTWHFSYFPTGVAVEIRYQRTSPDSAKQGSLGATRIGCRVKETDASVFRFKAVHNLGNL